MMILPKMIKIQQSFDESHIVDIEQEVKEQIQGLSLNMKKDARIAIAVGSRGVANLSRIVQATVDSIKSLGGVPFIVPAMGSHGGATAEGQSDVLREYGITEATIGAEIKSSMQVVELESEGFCCRIFMDKYASEADGIIIINRVKVHTDFHGTTESGLLKMCVIGLGKHKMALEIHRYGVYGLKELIPIAARRVLASGKIIMGLGIVENAYDQTAIIKAIQPEDMESEEINLLNWNRENMPSLPLEDIDVLIVDELGKDISGVGMDSNIIGRIRIQGQMEPQKPTIKSLVVTDLTEASHGNALGMGLADFITDRLYRKIDFKTTYENVITSTFVERGKMPIVAASSRAALQYALRTCGPIEIENAKIVRIKNTLKLDELYVSQKALDSIKGEVEIIGQWTDITDANGELSEFD